MKQTSVYLVIALVMLIYGSINYYIGMRGWQALGRFIPFLNRKIYWLFFWFLVASMLIARFSSKILPALNVKYLAWVGSYWLAAMFYLFLIIILIDGIRLITKWLGFLPPSFLENQQTSFITGLLVFFLVVGILIYGTWNAGNTQITHYDLTIPKKANKLKQLQVIMVSDIHLGSIVNSRELTKMVEMVNKLGPDIIILAGDIVDENITPFIEKEMADILKLLDSKYGTFAVTGNHEYIGGNSKEIIDYLEKGGVQVLKDKYVQIADSFYVVGRDDITGQYFNGGQKRKSLEVLLAQVDKNLPIILVDHQPRALKEAQVQGVDLQFSGHTHKGQLFPNHLITSRVFEVDWGYIYKDTLQVIVSSGFGTWGPPIRIGSKSEIVDVTINFSDS